MNEIPNYSQWRQVNSPDFNQYDYLYGCITQYGVPRDFIYALFKLLFPEFIEVNGGVFIKEIFREEKYYDLCRSHKNISIIEYWMNIFAVNTIFGEVDSPIENELISITLSSWRNKLLVDYPTRRFIVKALHDDEDTFLVVHSECEQAL